MCLVSFLTLLKMEEYNILVHTSCFGFFLTNEDYSFVFEETATLKFSVE